MIVSIIGIYTIGYILSFKHVAKLYDKDEMITALIVCIIYPLIIGDVL